MKIASNHKLWQLSQYVTALQKVALLKAVELFTPKKDRRCIKTHPYSLCVTSHDTMPPYTIRMRRPSGRPDGLRMRLVVRVRMACVHSSRTIVTVCIRVGHVV